MCNLSECDFCLQYVLCLPSSRKKMKMPMNTYWNRKNCISIRISTIFNYIFESYQFWDFNRIFPKSKNTLMFSIPEFIFFFRSANGLRMRQHFAWWIWSFYSIPPAPEGNYSLQIWLKVIKLNMPSYCIAICHRAMQNPKPGQNWLKELGWFHIVENCIN